MFLYCHLCLFRHNTYLQECTGVRDPSYPYNVHDVKLLVLKFAQEKSFSEDSGGGGRQSNMHLLPYIMHMALYVINTLVAASVSIVSCFWSGFKTMMLYVVVLIYTFRTRSVTREEKNLGNFLDATKDKWIENCYEVLKFNFVLKMLIIATKCTLLYKYVLFWMMVIFCLLFQTEGPLYWTTMALHILSPAKWKERRVKLLDRCMVLAQTRHVTPGGTKT